MSSTRIIVLLVASLCFAVMSSNAAAAALAMCEDRGGYASCEEFVWSNSVNEVLFLWNRPLDGMNWPSVYILTPTRVQTYVLCQSNNASAVEVTVRQKISMFILGSDVSNSWRCRAGQLV